MIQSEVGSGRRQAALGHVFGWRGAPQHGLAAMLWKRLRVFSFSLAFGCEIFRP